jgi:hypothetical protein
VDLSWLPSAPSKISGAPSKSTTSPALELSTAVRIFSSFLFRWGFIDDAFFSFSQSVSKLYYDKRQEAEGEKGEEEIKEAFLV